MPYSDDLRLRVVRFVKAGQSRREAARVFGVSPSFAIKLMQAYSRTGEVSAKPRGGARLGSPLAPFGPVGEVD